MSQTKALVAELRNVRLGLADEAAACIEQLQTRLDDMSIAFDLAKERADKAESALAAATAEREGLLTDILDYLITKDGKAMYWAHQHNLTQRIQAALTKAKGAT